ncbi:MAG: hypothetical protein ACK401_07540 [Archaeoglobaceae archaeon]
MRIVLHVSGHCIEKAAKMRYETLVLQLLRDEDLEKEKELEFLLEFMKKADFAELRKKGFDGSKEVFVVIRKEGDEFLVESVEEKVS